MDEECYFCGNIVDTNKQGHFHNEECEYTGCGLCDDSSIAKELKNKFFCSVECELNFLKEKRIF